MAEYVFKISHPPNAKFGGDRSEISISFKDEDGDTLELILRSEHLDRLLTTLNEISMALTTFQPSTGPNAR